MNNFLTVAPAQYKRFTDGDKDYMEKTKEKLLEENLKSLGGKNAISVDREIRLIEKHDVRIITIEDSEYPENLKNIYNAPTVLYVKGRILQKDYYNIAIVGSRRCSIYGQNIAETLARQLAERGFTITSGIARGIDTYAHRGALKVRGRTIGVLGCGINIAYPPENKKLIDEIGSYGAVISEFPMNTQPNRYNFPRRNRIISGLSLGVVIVEAAQKSGALITASFASEQGREVFSVPGRVDTPTSRGTSGLIKDGAKLVENVEDILEEIRSKPNVQGREVVLPRINMTDEEAIVFNSLSDEPKHIDEIKEACDLDFDKLPAVLLKLELKKIVKELPGKKYVKKTCYS